MEDTWASREMPVLTAVVEAFEETLGSRAPRGSEIAEATGLSADEVGQALLALDGEYLKLVRTLNPTPEVWRVAEIYSDARRAVGQWPSPETFLNRLTAALEQVADDTEDTQAKGKLKQAASLLGGLAQKIVVEVGAKMLEHQAGLG